jgi:hypothetical protein
MLAILAVLEDCFASIFIKSLLHRWRNLQELEDAICNNSSCIGDEKRTRR